MKKDSKKAGILTKGLWLFAILTIAIPASAQQCQTMLGSKRFTLIVPYSPGGGYDGYARVFASQFEATTDSAMRIRYLPGAGGIIGIDAVVEAGPADLVLGLFNPIVLLNDRIVGRESQEMGSLIMLGSLHSDATVWATRTDHQVLFESAEPRFFPLASNTDFFRILLPGYTLGWNINLIRGYSGSSETLLALLRGDVDYFYNSSATMANRIQSSEGLTTFISLTDGPNPIFPEAAYLAGAGGVVEQLTSELSLEQRQQRQEVARLVVELAKTHRALSISSGADPALVNCLLAAVETILFSDELEATAAVQNLFIEPKNGVGFQEELDAAEALVESHWTLLQDLAARLQ